MERPIYFLEEQSGVIAVACSGQLVLLLGAERMRADGRGPLPPVDDRSRLGQVDGGAGRVEGLRELCLELLTLLRRPLRQREANSRPGPRWWTDSRGPAAVCRFRRLSR